MACGSRRAERRRGDSPQLTLRTELAESLSGDEETILKVHEALLALEQADARLAQVVEMRYFGGYSVQEIGRDARIDGTHGFARLGQSPAYPAGGAEVGVSLSGRIVLGLDPLGRL